MSRGKLREDKTCLNCGTLVENRFCPQCGQENTETRKSFHYLFTHVVEDLVHYDSGFWKTIKYLLFYPARLTKEYLSGKRKSFVEPVKLYIFISFITFFITGILIPVKSLNFNNDETITSTEKIKKNPNQTNDTLTEHLKTNKNKEYGWIAGYKSVRELDSVQNTNPKNKLSPEQYWITKKMVSVAEHNTIQEAFKKALELFIRNLPKVLFLYMPLFAFWLWLIHGKKHWYYFDHGIFTLHYFSFLLLFTSMFIVIEWLLNKSDWMVVSFFQILFLTIYFIWPVIYFYRAHKILYSETKFISFLKSSGLFIINIIAILILLLGYSLYTFISIE